MIDACVPAGHQQGHEGKLRWIRLEKDGVDVGFQMIHADPGNPVAVGKPLGEGEAYQQGADQAGALGDGHAVDFICRDL